MGRCVPYNRARTLWWAVDTTSQSLRRKGPDKGFFVARKNGPQAHFLFENRVLGISMTGDELQSLLEPTIGNMGYELVDLELRLGGRDGVVRVFIDHPDGIGLDDCEKVSRVVSALLDIEDPLPGHYNLEVSSPGLDRKLTKIEHFQRFAGETVKVQMRIPIAGRKRFRGTLVTSDDENIVVDVDGESHTLPVATIDTARLVP